MKVPEKTSELINRLKSLQGQPRAISQALQDQQIGRRQAYELLERTIEVLKDLKQSLERQMKNVGSAMTQMNASIEALLEQANSEQTAQLESLMRSASILTPTLDKAGVINKGLDDAIQSLKGLIDQNPADMPPLPPPADMPPPPPAEAGPYGGRRNRRKHQGGYTYRKTRTPSRRTKTRKTRK